MEDQIEETIALPDPRTKNVKTKKVSQKVELQKRVYCGIAICSIIYIVLLSLIVGLILLIVGLTQ